MKYKLTSMCGIQNEARYVPEWIEFHLMQGFEHFFIYDNNSKDFLYERIEPYIREGLVTVIPVPHTLYNKAPGGWMLKDSLNRARHVSKWHMPGTSIDEYVFVRDGRKVSDLLDEFDAYGALSISWVLFNSSGQLAYDSRPVVERFTNTYPEGTLHVKSIVQPARTASYRDPHSFNFHAPFISVTENHEACPTAHPPRFSANRIVIHHYHMMSVEEWNVKMNKGRSDIAGYEGVRRAEAEIVWQYAHSHPVTVDLSAQKYLETLKERLNARYGK